MSKQNFENFLLEAIDEGLSSLGESSKQAIYFHLEKSFKIKKQEIPRKIEVFADAIEKIFGSGADFLEILIMKRLHEKIEGKIELQKSTDFTFNEYVSLVKRSLMEKNKTKGILEMVVQCKDTELEV